MFNCQNVQIPNELMFSSYRIIIMIICLFFSVPLTAASIVISILNLFWTLGQLQWLDLKYLSKAHRFIIPSPRQSYAKMMITSMISFFGWFSVASLVAIASIVGLSVVTWVEVFSDELLTDEVGVGVVRGNTIYILPMLMLVLPVPINALVHSHYLGNCSHFSLAFGALSAIFPTKFIHDKSPSKTKKFVRINQSIWWLSHVLAWVVYGACIYSDYLEDTGFSKLLPVALACLTFGPMLGAIHWSYSINQRFV